MHLYLVSGIGMLSVALIGATLWRWRTGAQWRWFWIGAGVWFVAVVGKVVWSLLINPPLFELMKEHWPTSVYQLTGAIYVGVNSAIWEVGITGLAALRWRGMTLHPGRAAGVGVGAGAIEAALVGIAVFTSVLIAMAGGPGSQEIVDSVAEGSQQTPLAWLAGPTERVIAVLGHTSTRMLVLLAVARQRWWLFWCGFTLFTLVDGIAGYVHVAGLVSTISMWWVELALVPVAIISVPIILTCYRRWPETTSSDT